MVRIKKLALIMLLILASAAVYPSVVDNKGFAAEQGDLEEIKPVIKGAVEDDSWLYAPDAAYIEESLGKYYGGELLKKLAGEAWEFKKKNTDWYSRTRLVSLRITRHDENGATVLAVIDVEDCNTGGRQRGSAVFDISREGGDWRVVHVVYKWSAEV